MCSVTFVPQPEGYQLGMNRDEQRARPAGLPPGTFDVAGVHCLHPFEPSGGTWISTNDRRITFALINWYSITERIPANSLSRGEIVRRLRGITAFDQAVAQLETLPLKHVNPFRLIGVFPSGQRVCEWRWDCRRLERVEHPWAAHFWASSGFDEPGAQRERGLVFQRAIAGAEAGSVDWLRRLHASHEPERGAYSICMHRADAVTVSYTEVELRASGVRMRHGTGAPCECEQWEERALAVALIPR